VPVALVRPGIGGLAEPLRAGPLAGLVVALEPPDRLAVFPEGEAVAHAAVRQELGVADFVDSVAPGHRRSGMTRADGRACRARLPELGHRAPQDDRFAAPVLDTGGAEGLRRIGHGPFSDYSGWV